MILIFLKNFIILVWIFFLIIFYLFNIILFLMRFFFVFLIILFNIVFDHLFFRNAFRSCLRTHFEHVSTLNFLVLFHFFEIADCTLASACNRRPRLLSEWHGGCSRLLSREPKHFHGPTCALKALRTNVELVVSVLHLRLEVWCVPSAGGGVKWVLLVLEWG